MQLFQIKHPARLVAVVAAVLALAAALAFALLSGGTPTATAAVAHAAKHAPHHAVRHHATKTSDTPGATDPDNVQSGDQTSPDAPGTTAGPSENVGSGESSTETEAGQPGEPATGHQDPISTTDHQCDGNCVE